jgi:predicted nucleic acid-binding protein
MNAIVVKDSNLFIDLELMGMTHLWLQLPFRTITTSLVVNELENGGHSLSLSLIRDGQIEEYVVESGELFELIETYNHLELGETDLSVLLAAEKYQGMILSGDGALRKIAMERKIEVHGTIWVLEELIKAGKITPLMAAERLSYLLDLKGTKRRFLPKSVCAARIEFWRQ